MREIVLDTETTGLDPNDGHRVIDIGCVELEDRLPTGRDYHVYLNPDRDVPEEVVKVHGITSEFLADKPRFAEICDEFLAFIGDSQLVIHNAPFDMRFLNAELARLKRPPLTFDRVVDSMEIAKAKFPGARYSLDELCRRFEIDLSRRDKHGALLDSELTAAVYLELMGGRQTALSLSPIDRGGPAMQAKACTVRPTPLPSRLTADEAAAHQAFIAKDLGNDPVWKKIDVG